jgi:hypothetical protein
MALPKKGRRNQGATEGCNVVETFQRQSVVLVVLVVVASNRRGKADVSACSFGWSAGKGLLAGGYELIQAFTLLVLLLLEIASDGASVVAGVVAAGCYGCFGSSVGRLLWNNRPGQAVAVVFVVQGGVSENVVVVVDVERIKAREDERMKNSGGFLFSCRLRLGGC